MAWRRVTRLVERFAPRAIRTGWRECLAGQFVTRLRRERTLEGKVAIATGKHPFRSNQRPREILGLLRALTNLRPRAVCEIGCDRGGTLALLAQVSAADALLVSIDPLHANGNTQGFRRFVRGAQRLVCLAGDSHQPHVLRQLSELLDGQPLDFLFVDGDHSLAGVQQDYAMYAPLLRPGGLLAFHDIVPEVQQLSHGLGRSTSYVGGVPAFWEQLRARHARTETLVEREDQDGFGIGLIRWPSASPAFAVGTGS